MFRTPRRSPAEQFAAEMRAAPDQELRVTVRELRTRFGIARLTPFARLDITRLLASHGVVVDPPLAGEDGAATSVSLVTLRPRRREVVSDQAMPFGPPRPRTTPPSLAVGPGRMSPVGRKWRPHLPHRAVRTRHG